MCQNMAILIFDFINCTMKVYSIYNACGGTMKTKHLIKVKSSHLKNQTLIYTNNELDEEQLKNAIKATGYEVRSINKEVK